MSSLFLLVSLDCQEYAQYTTRSGVIMVTGDGGLLNQQLPANATHPGNGLQAEKKASPIFHQGRQRIGLKSGGDSRDVLDRWVSAAAGW